MADSGEQLDALFDLTSELLAVADSSGRFLRLNRAWRIALDLDPSGLVGTSVFDLVEPGGRARVRDLLVAPQQADKVPPRFELLVRDGAGEIRTLLARMAKRGELLLITARVGEVNELVGELSPTEGELGGPLARFSFERAPDAVLWLGPDADIRYVNQSACDHLGYDREELLGMTVHEIDTTASAEGWPVHWEHLKRVKSMTVESQHRHKNGETFPVEIRLNYLDFEGRELVCAMARDITERIEDRRAIERKSNELETLLYISSHDLREPLRAMRGFADILSRRYSDVLDEKGCDYLRRIRGGGDRLEQLLDDLLSMSRLQQAEPELETVSGRVIVDGVIAQLEGRITDAGATIHVEEELPLLSANPNLAGHALLNLIANAIKFGHGEEPEVGAVVEVGGFENRTGPAGRGRAGLVVRDRGPGVPPEHTERIFEMFQRAVGREIEGTGAGLAIARRIARMHGGEAWVEPREGGGSEFFLSFQSP